MNRSHWMVAGISVAATLTVIWSMNWFVEQLNPDRHPGRLAYKPVEGMPPHVDLASVQRGWPTNLDEPGDRSRLLAYKRDMEGQAPPPLAGPAASSAPEPPPDLGTLLASADAESGKGKSRVCMSCHDLTAGGPDRIGPNLWGVIGRDIAARSGFAYSSAMTAQQGTWTYDRINAYLESPARAVPGNKMSFAGLRRPEDRAAVIRYLATLGSNTPPMPPPQSAGPTGKAR